MIELYPAGTSEFTRHGVTLHPTECTVHFNFKAASQYDLDLSLPLYWDGELSRECALIDFGMIVYASVPPMYVPPISMGQVSHWRIPAGSDPVPLYSTVPHSERVKYQAWSPGRSYMAGEKVTDGGVNYQCSTGHGGIYTPPSQNPSLWSTISNYKWVPGTVLAQLPAGTLLLKTRDYGSTYMQVYLADGRTGYIEISKCEEVDAESEEYVLPARTITHQPFIVTEIRKSDKNSVFTVHAQQLSYILNRILLGDCQLVRATPQTALAFIQAGMKAEYTGQLITNLSEPLISQDWSWKYAGEAVMHPDSGVRGLLNARLIRDKYDVLLLENTYTAPSYEIRYGTNLLGVTWKGDVNSLIGRVYPRAKKANGDPLMLDDEFIASDKDLPIPGMERLDVGLKVGDREEQTDGTTVTLTEAMVKERMRQQAEDRFNVDRCDQPIVELDVEFTRLGDTEEYAQYRGLEPLWPFSWVRVLHGPLDIDVVFQLLSGAWDSKNERYLKAGFGDLRRLVGRSVAGWQLVSGSVGVRALSDDLKKTLGV